MANDRERGVYDKYNVVRLNDPDGKHARCYYFVLDFEHDPYAGEAALAYAHACEADYPLLAADLRARVQERKLQVADS